MAPQKRTRSPSLEVVDHRRAARTPIATRNDHQSGAYKGRDKRVQDVLAFARELLAALPEASQETYVSELLQADVSHHIQELVSLLDKGENGKGHRSKIAKDIERQGREVWNTCIRLRRDQKQDFSTTKGTKIVSAAKLFAFLMICVAREDFSGNLFLSEADAVYLLSLALSSAKASVQDGDTAFAKIALRKSDAYLANLQQGSLSHAVTKRVQRLNVDNAAMKMAMAWRENRMDDAEQDFRRLPVVHNNLDRESAETTCATLQLIGADLLKKNDTEKALVWLKRAYDVITVADPDILSIDGTELRLAVYQSLFQALMREASPDSLQRAEELVISAGTEMGDKPIVLHWRLELLQNTPEEEVFKSQQYASTLRRMIRVFDGAEETFRFLLHHIKELNKGTVTLATGLLDELLLQKVVISDNTGQIGSALVQRIWLATSGNETASAITSLRTLLDATHDALPAQIEPDIAGAAHSLIWKKVEAAIAREDFQIADDWCQIGLHPIFASSGQVNLGKFCRKRLICAISMRDAELGDQAYREMSLGCQKEALTLFLMFRLGLANLDHNLTQRTLEDIGKCDKKQQCQDLLYACIKEASAAGDKVSILAALKQITKRWTLDEVVTDNFPALLRCTIRMINTLGEDSAFEGWLNGKSMPDEAEDLCILFEKGTNFARQDPRDENGNKIFTIQELDWFRKNAFNIGISKTQAWDLSHLVRIFQTCVAFATLYPTDLPLSSVTDITLMTMRCHFISAAALVSQARSEDGVEEQLQRYVEVRQQAASFDAAMALEVEGQREDVTHDLMGKAAALFAFDFEAAVALRGWDDLNEIVRKAGICRDVGMFKAMGDCLLRSHATGRVLYGTLGLIINEIFALEGLDVAKIAKYIRCLFQAVLPEEDTLALSVLDQAIQVAKEGKDQARPFPTEEMEWLVASTFNHAVDYFARREENLCHQWALKAIELAQYADDQGALRKLLEDRLVRLQLPS